MMKVVMRLSLQFISIIVDFVWKYFQLQLFIGPAHRNQTAVQRSLGSNVDVQRLAAKEPDISFGGGEDKAKINFGFHRICNSYPEFSAVSLKVDLIRNQVALKAAVIKIQSVLASLFAYAGKYSPNKHLYKIGLPQNED